MTRKICILTGSRADYSHLSPVIEAVNLHPGLSMQLIVTGQHIDKKYGSTWKNIKNDGHKITRKIDIRLNSDTPLETTQSMGRAVSLISKNLCELNPDILVLLGDRFETFSAGIAALILNIPIAHIHGGEETVAAFDDAIRHALTKISHIHFCSAKLYANRVRQMGENPERIHLVGAPGLDQLHTINYLNSLQLSSKLKINLKNRIFVIGYHPVTLKLNETERSINSLINALRGFEDTTLVFTGVNSDPGNNTISNIINEFVKLSPKNRIFINTMDKENYLSLMKISSVIIGNSSAGLIEAPALGVPTVNIGDRQKGRITSSSVINCLEKEEEILKAIKRAISPNFRKKVFKSKNLKGRNASKKIAEILANENISEISIKNFHDLNWGEK